MKSAAATRGDALRCDHSISLRSPLAILVHSYRTTLLFINLLSAQYDIRFSCIDMPVGPRRFLLLQETQDYIPVSLLGVAMMRRGAARRIIYHGLSLPPEIALNARIGWERAPD
jgi:hypothetical protein